MHQSVLLGKHAMGAMANCHTLSLFSNQIGDVGITAFCSSHQARQ